MKWSMMILPVILAVGGFPLFATADIAPPYTTNAGNTFAFSSLDDLTDAYDATADLPRTPGLTGQYPGGMTLVPRNQLSQSLSTSTAPAYSLRHLEQREFRASH